MPKITADLIVHAASELCTVDSSAGTADPLRALPDASLASRQGEIVWVGPAARLEAEVEELPGCRVVDAAGCTVTPGFVDCHTHVVFAGERADEFAQRCAGATYLEIAQRGGGIEATVRATRTASEETLIELARPRLARLLEFGVTTAEGKSGYGLDLESELKMLRALRRLGEVQPIELVPTLLCAHAVPSDFARRRDEYVELCRKQIVPAAAREGLARFCDAFVEKGAFTVEEGRAILRAGKDLGMIPRLHADQMSAMGASALAAELGAATADHLECVDEKGIAALAAAGVSAVLVPVSTFFLRQDRWAPGRALWEAGVNVALATNVNPGSAMSENVGLTLSLACLYNGLTTPQAIYGFTRGAARALRLEGRLGALRPGLQADVVVHACASHAHLPYHLGVPHARTVIKRGRVVFEARRDVCRGG